MSVKAFCAQQIPCDSLCIRGSKHRLMANYWFLFAFTCLLLGMQPVPVAQAAEAAVLCDLTASDEMSLIQAINCINAGGVGAHTVTLINDILLTQPLPVLTNRDATEILIEGNGHTLDAAGTGRVLSIELVQKLTLHNIILTGGQTDVNGLSPNGGGLSLVCGEDLDCNWTLLNTVVRNNQGAAGGGILYRCDYHGGGTLLVQDSVIRDNEASGAGGGLIYSSDEESGFCSVTLRNTLIEGNRAVEGGAFRILRPRVTIIDSTIRNNIATENGGGILARISDGFIDMTVRNSTISGNRAELNGGGLYIESPDQTFEIQLVNSTVSGNTATTGAGGGLYLGETNDSLRIALLNSTVTQNAATQGAGVHVFHRDSSFEITGTLRLNNSIIADNLGDDCGGELAGGGLFSGERVTSFGYNLDSDGTCLTPSVRQLSDIPNGAAQLGPLAANGGRTQTHLLLTGSAAFDAGDDAVCAAAPVDGADQRGELRPQGPHCDMGAVEVQPDEGQGVSFTVTKFTDSNDGNCDADCSLREAIAAANLRPSPDQIQLESGTYLLTIPTLRDSENDSVDEDDNAIGDLDIVDDLVLVGKGAAATIIDGNQGDRVLEVLSTAKVTIEALAIRNGLMSEMGGGLSNSGTLLLNRVHVVDNRATSALRIGHGGGLFNDGILTVINSLLANNHAAGGEASYGEGGAIRNDGVMTITQSTIQNNSVSDDNDYGIGGGIVNQGTLQIERSTLTDNHTVRGPGGAIANRLDGRLTVINSTISANGSGSGAGIANGNAVDDPGAVLLIHTTIANNIGGGLYNRGVTTATNTIIAGNLLDVDENTTAQNCYNEGTFTSLGAMLLGNVGNCPSDGLGDITIDNTTVFTALLGPLTDNGGPTLTHALLAGSVAIDRANDTNCAMEAVGGVDQRGGVRPQGPACDIGAYEAAAQIANNLLFVSSRSSGRAGDIAFRDEDILAYDDGDGSWSMIFDGSDVGITKDVNAFHVQADGSLLLSFNGRTTVLGLGAVDDSDIVRFIPTALGSQTAGSFAWYLRGDDVGLSTDSEDIDAIGFTADGHLVISTIGDFQVAQLKGKDEDLWLLNNAVFGNPSSGAWTLFFDGSTVGLANEDVNGLWIDPASSELYLTVKDQFAFAQQDIDSNDIFVCAFSPAGACSYTFFWDADQHNYGADNLDSIGLGLLPPVLSAAVQKSALEPGADVDAWTDEESDDLEVEEHSLRVFLPIVTQAAVDD